MKKLVLVICGLAVLASLGLSSCTRECTCKTTSDVPGSTEITQTVETKEKCAELNSTVTAGGYTTTMKCD